MEGGNKQRLCIVGAGISGLVACKHAVEKGFHPTVLEASDGIGGVWARTLWSTKLQSTSATFRFTDYPWPSSVEDAHPDHAQVMGYLQSYASHFDLLRWVRFGTKVVGLEFIGVGEEEMARWDRWSGNGEAFGDGRGVWRLMVQVSGQQEPKMYEFDFVVLCIGRFSGIPHIPKFVDNGGPSIFKGMTMHSMDFVGLDHAKFDKLIRGKKIIVVGSGKSALDITAECARVNGENQPCTMIYRSKRWILDNVTPGGLDIGYICGNRFHELLLHKPTTKGFLNNVARIFLSPMRGVISKALDTYYRLKLPLLGKHGILPSYSVYDAVSTCSFSIAPSNFFEMLESKRIILKEVKSFRFYHYGIVINDEKECVEADLVIFATGFEGDLKLKNLFPSGCFQDIIFNTSDNMTGALYRHCIHPRIPQLAVLGYADSFSTLFTSEMMSKWLACLLHGFFRLPAIQEMQKDVLKWVECTKMYERKPQHWTCIQASNIQYNDQLCKDMRYNPKRKISFLAEWFQPYRPADYKNI